MLKLSDLHRITLGFDGSVLSIGRRAEGTAAGFNKKKKGQRSYYPLYCTVAQTGQVLNVLHRSGNAHDSNGAETFILACIQAGCLKQLLRLEWIVHFLAKKWDKKNRFIFVRQKTKQQQKGLIQLDLFGPISRKHQYKVVLTNKTIGAKK